MKWRFRLAARTHASHAWNTGSIPVGATKRPNKEKKSETLTTMSRSFSFIPLLSYCRNRVCRVAHPICCF